MGEVVDMAKIGDELLKQGWSREILADKRYSQFAGNCHKRVSYGVPHLPRCAEGRAFR